MGAGRDSFTSRDSVAHLLTKLGILRQKTEQYENSGRAKSRDKAEKMARAVKRKVDAKYEEHEMQRKDKLKAEPVAALSGKHPKAEHKIYIDA